MPSKDPEARKAASRKWREKNREYLKAYNAEWRKANPEYGKLQKRKRAEEKPDVVRAEKRAHYEANKERYSVLHKAWLSDNIERVREQSRAYRMTEAGIKQIVKSNLKRELKAHAPADFVCLKTKHIMLYRALKSKGIKP